MGELLNKSSIPVFEIIELLFHCNKIKFWSLSVTWHEPVLGKLITPDSMPLAGTLSVAVGTYININEFSSTNSKLYLD